MKSITVNTLVNVVLYGALFSEILFAVAGGSLIMWDKTWKDNFGMNPMIDTKVAWIITAGAISGILGLSTVLYRKHLPVWIPLVLLVVSAATSISAPFLLDVPGLEYESGDLKQEIAGYFVYMAMGPLKVVIALNLLLDFLRLFNVGSPAMFYNFFKIGLLVNESMIMYASALGLKDDKTDANIFSVAGIGASLASIMLSFAISRSASRSARIVCGFVSFMSVVGTILYVAEWGVLANDNKDLSMDPGFEYHMTHIILMGSGLIGTRIAFFLAQLPSVDMQQDNDQKNTTTRRREQNLPVAECRPVQQMVQVSSNLV